MNEALRPTSLRTRWLGRELRTADVLASTNTAVADWALEGAPHGAVVVAARQHEGRGRQGRRWESPPGNLYVSCLLRPARALSAMAPLSLVTGLGVVETLRRAWAVDDAGLKWPNDVWIGERKVAGVLLESRAHPTPTIVVGLGLNLRTPEGGWSEDLRGRAIALDEVGLDLDVATSLEALLPILEEHVDGFLQDGLEPLLDELRSVSLLDGRRVSVLDRGRSEVFDVIGIAVDGALRVRSPQGEERLLHAGEVHLGDVAP